MRLSACLLLLLVVGAGAPPTTSASGSDTHRLDVEVGLDRTLRVTWRFDSPAGILELRVPEGATLVAMEGGRAVVNGSRLAFDGRAHSVELTLVTPPPDESLHPLYSARLALPAAGRLEVSLRVPPEHRLFHVSHGQLAADGLSLSYAGRGGVDLVLAYRAPVDADAGIVEFEEGIYHVVAPARGELAARRIASLASNASVAAVAHAGLPLPTPVWVRFAPERAFGAEAGSYGNDGIVALSRDALSMGALDGHPWRAVETLTHETFHLASLPHGDRRLAENVTWWLEGSARYSERFASGVDGWTACEEGWCVPFQSQLNATQLRIAYDGSFGFLPGWTPQGASEVRYRHAAFLVAAYADRYGGSAYRAVWQDVRAGAADPACACDEVWLLQLLVRHSGGRATRDELYRPFGDLRQDDRAAFDARVGPLVAHDPVPGAPMPWRPRASNATAAPPVAPFVPPSVSLEPPLASVPDAILRGRVAGLTLLEDPEATTPPEARLVVRLDGEAASPASLVVSRGNVTLVFSGLPPGEHVVALEAVGLHGAPFVPALRSEVRFVVHPAYAIALDALPSGVTAPPLLLGATVRDASSNVTLANVSVALYEDGARVGGTRSGEAGRVYFEVARVARPDALLALVVEDEHGTALADASLRLSAAPLATHAGEVPAAGVDSESARPTAAPGALGALGALAAGAAGAALVAGGRRSRRRG